MLSDSLAALRKYQDLALAILRHHACGGLISVSMLFLRDGASGHSKALKSHWSEPSVPCGRSTHEERRLAYSI